MNAGTAAERAIASCTVYRPKNRQQTPYEQQYDAIIFFETSLPSAATVLYKPSKLIYETRIHHSEGNCWTRVDHFGNHVVALFSLVLSFLWCRVERVSGHPRPPSVEALVYRGCPCRDPPVWQSANPVRAVGASPVILSPTSNVFVNLCSVMVFRTAKL